MWISHFFYNFLLNLEKLTCTAIQMKNTLVSIESTSRETKHLDLEYDLMVAV